MHFKWSIFEQKKWLLRRRQTLLAKKCDLAFSPEMESAFLESLFSPRRLFRGWKNRFSSLGRKSQRISSILFHDAITDHVSLESWSLRQNPASYLKVAHENLIQSPFEDKTLPTIWKSSIEIFAALLSHEIAFLSLMKQSFYKELNNSLKIPLEKNLIIAKSPKMNSLMLKISCRFFVNRMCF